ncbi:MAG: hypothetical protein KatS3mg124_2458 [Porticoccaceae bacterium]|nr:MAG: hypothetical protein KatS3mg124_2458 [Porticoccaceae bacterium]
MERVADERWLERTVPMAEVAAGLEGLGYALVEGFLTADEVAALRARAAARRGAFVPAAVGRGPAARRDRRLRGDRICWLDSAHPVERAWLARMEAVRLALNRRLLLGLFEYEGHFAAYPPGARYARHLDSLRGGAQPPGERGVLSEPARLGRHRRRRARPLPAGGVWPCPSRPGGGCLVLFLSEEIPHEVRPARRERLSIAGWFRVNGSTAGRVDPPR